MSTLYNCRVARKFQPQIEQSKQCKVAYLMYNLHFKSETERSDTLLSPTYLEEVRSGKVSHRLFARLRVYDDLRAASDVAVKCGCFVVITRAPPRVTFAINCENVERSGENRNRISQRYGRLCHRKQ